MNQKNAAYIGRREGYNFQNSLDRMITKEAYEQNGKNVVHFYSSYPITQELFLDGWNSAYIAPRKHEPPVSHNPNTRFCDCADCRGKDHV